MAFIGRARGHCLNPVASFVDVVAELHSSFETVQEHARGSRVVCVRRFLFCRLALTHTHAVVCRMRARHEPATELSQARVLSNTFRLEHCPWNSLPSSSVCISGTRVSRQLQQCPVPHIFRVRAFSVTRRFYVRQIRPSSRSKIVPATKEEE